MANQSAFVETPREFFNEIKTALSLLKKEQDVTYRNFFFITAGLYHLREWIAPGYHHSNDAIKSNQKFYNSIYDDCIEYLTVQNVCNGNKHFGDKGVKVSGNPSPVLADWKRLSDVPSLKNGAPQQFTIDGQSAVEIFESVVKFYDQHWFKDNPTGICSE